MSINREPYRHIRWHLLGIFSMLIKWMYFGQFCGFMDNKTYFDMNMPRPTCCGDSVWSVLPKADFSSLSGTLILLDYTIDVSSDKINNTNILWIPANCISVFKQNISVRFSTYINMYYCTTSTEKDKICCSKYVLIKKFGSSDVCVLLGLYILTYWDRRFYTCLFSDCL